MSTMTLDATAPSRTLDPLLRPYFAKVSEQSAENVLSSILIQDAEPIIRKIVGYKFRGIGTKADSREASEVDDICNDVLLQLIRKLRRARVLEGTEPIASFRSYVATAAYRGCDAYLREKHPERYRLRNRVQYILSHHADFVLQKDDNDVWQCSLSSWSGKPHLADGSARLSELSHSHHNLVDTSGEELSGRQLLETLSRVLTAAGGPVKIEPLVSLLHAATQSPCTSDESVERIADSGAGVGAVLEQQSYLRRLWSELLELPQPQRIALLFNLRTSGGGEVISLLPLLGVASIATIAGAVGFEVEKFAPFWNDLPWDDHRISALLGVTRQQVINLRKSGRERLTRRMRSLHPSTRVAR